MLLRNNSLNRGEADQDIFLSMASSNPPEQEDELTQTAPARTTHSAYHTGHEEVSSANQDFDDVWGADDDDTSLVSPPPRTEVVAAAAAAGGGGGGTRTRAEVSDIPRLKQEHTTAGYRDGVTLAKAASVQAGFDEGYGLGASIGAYAGRLLGVLTGLVGALTSSPSPSNTGTGEDTAEHHENERLRTLLETATKELSVLSVFGEEYFARDGTWRYEVQSQATPTLASSLALGKESGEGTEEEGGEEHIVFADIAAAHPLVRKWDGILKQEARRYGLVWDVLLPEGEEGQGHDHEEDGKDVTNKDGKGDDGGSGGGGKKPIPVRQSKGSLAW